MYLELRAVPSQRPGDWRLLLEEEPAAGVARSLGRSSSISSGGGGQGREICPERSWASMWTGRGVQQPGSMQVSGQVEDG